MRRFSGEFSPSTLECACSSYHGGAILIIAAKMLHARARPLHGGVYNCLDLLHILCEASAMDQITLVKEADSARSLAAHGVEAMENISSVISGADPVLACLALASEKMLKMTIGMATVARGNPWPDRRRMVGYGHNIQKMNQEAMALVLERVDEATHTPVVLTAALASVDISWTEPLLATLSEYGSGGRFYNLDTLGGQRPKRPSPSVMWGAMESAVIARHPIVLESLAAARSTAAEARRPLNLNLGRAFRSWWNFYATSWKQGIVGEEARALGWSISLNS